MNKKGTLTLALALALLPALGMAQTQIKTTGIADGEGA